MSKLFGPVRQMAYIVHDIEKAMAFWIKSMGVGPFFYLKNHARGGSTYRGQPTDSRISLAFAHSGTLQIELIQQLNDAPSLFRDFLATGREGLQHVAFWTKTFDADMKRYLGMGYTIVQQAGFDGPNNRNAFIVANADDPIVIEISEISGTKGAFFEQIAEAARAWDGSDPIRLVEPKSA